MNFTRSGSSGCAARVFSLPAMTRPVVPSSEIQSPCLKVLPLTRSSFLRFVDDAVAGAGHAALAHAAGDDSRVRGHAAARGENAGGHFHAGDVLRCGFAANQDDGRVGALLVMLHGIFRGEDDLADSRARRCRQAGGEHFNLLALFHEARNQEVIQLVRLDAEDGFFLRDEAFAHHVDGDANRGQAGALAVAGLQHVELAILDGELEVLHVAIVLFHLPGNGLEMVVDLGHGPFELADRACGVRTPETTSSPCAFIRYSPKNTCSPVAGLRVKPTPVPEFSPRLPNTMACTLTAVPSQSSMWLMRR